jgi:hypothetical protein
MKKDSVSKGMGHPKLFGADESQNPHDCVDSSAARGKNFLPQRSQRKAAKTLSKSFDFACLGVLGGLSLRPLRLKAF